MIIPRYEERHNQRANLTIATNEEILNQLKSDAERHGQSLNAKINTILTKYIQFYSHVEEQRGFISPNEIWTAVVNLIDENKMIEILEENGVRTFLTVFEHNNIPLTVDNLIKYLFETMALWAGCYYRFSSYTDGQGYLNLVFEHSHGIKWSKAMGTVFTRFIRKALNSSSELKVTAATATIRIKI